MPPPLLLLLLLLLLVAAAAVAAFAAAACCKQLAKQPLENLLLSITYGRSSASLRMKAEDTNLFVVVAQVVEYQAWVPEVLGSDPNILCCCSFFVYEYLTLH